MSFYVHHQKLESHADDLADQIGRVRNLLSRLQFLEKVSPSEDALALRRCIRRLERVEEAYERSRKVLLEFSEDTATFSRDVGETIEDLRDMAKRVFS